MLTAKTYLKPDEWLELFDEIGYTGYYYWTILTKRWNSHLIQNIRTNF